MRVVQRFLILSAAALAAFVATAESAQAQQRRPDPDFWFRPSQGLPAAATQIVGLGHPLGSLALFAEARQQLFWPEPIVDGVRPLTEFLLADVRDDRVFPDFRKWLNAPDQMPKDLLNEKLAYVEALVNSQRTPVELFAAAAKENQGLTFTHLYNEPAKHRGDIVTLEGKLRRLLRFDPPAEAADQGVRRVWEGWLFLDSQGKPPVIIHFAELPEGFKEGESVDYRVKFSGYFFKKYPYLDSKKKPMTTLLFIGPTVTVVPVPPVERQESIIGTVIVYTILGILGCTVVLIVGLTWYFRKSDERVRARLAHARGSPFFEPGLLQEPPAREGE